MNLKFIVILFLTLFFFAGCRSEQIVNKTPQSDSESFDEWAGLNTTDEKHKAIMDKSWEKLLSTKEKIQNHLKQKSIHLESDTVVYPFSGIDVLNLFAFFPNSKSYILFGLEDPGFPTNYNEQNEREKQIVKHGISSLSEHLAGRNYFTYRKMKEETKKRELNGAYPVFVAFLRRMDKEILDSNIELIQGNGIQYKGFSLLLYDKKSNLTQKFTYYKIFLTGKEGVNGDGLTEYFSNLGPKAVFTKSAEYLFHGEKRALFRDLLLKDTKLIVQDESGFPLRLFPTENWDKHILGRYERSWNLSGAVAPEEQKELKDLSEKTANDPLPFPFGYGFLGTKDNRQSAVLIFKQKNKSN